MVSLKPAFARDFEVSRGLTAPKGAVPSRWARVRHDFAPGAAFITAQYSIATDENGGVIETLVLVPRDRLPDALVALRSAGHAVREPG